MHWRIGDRLGFTRKLGFRLGMLLSVAILPLALISLIQNFNLVRSAERSVEIALLGRTTSAAAGERALLHSALGSADALGPGLLDMMDQPELCSELMRSFIQRSATYVSASFVRMDGISSCSSNRNATPIDVSDSDAYKQFIAEPGTLVTSLKSGPLSGRPVVVVMQPLYRDRELLGYVALSLTYELLRSTHDLTLGTEGARVITFNHRGHVLSQDGDDQNLDAEILPQNTELVNLLSSNDTTLRARDNSGDMRVFTVVPVVPGLVYALGSWSPNVAGGSLFQLSRFGAVAIPVALWLVSLAVAYFAVFRLVLRHITVLRGQMRRFAIGNRSEPPPVLIRAPSEIADVSQTFHNMARILIRDEEAMEEAVTEKTVLLKEVHHRVKNNLQLIASIINMQARMVDDPDAKAVLRSVQERVAALATIYRNLYQAEHLDSVDAGRLIGDIINQMINASTSSSSDLKVETEVQPLILLPDQAIPLSLLATEAVTNAIKYAGVSDDADRAWVRVRLTSPKPGRATLEIANSMGQREYPGEGTGLGSQLIEAFSTQLEGEATIASTENDYTLKLDFAIDSGVFGGANDPRNVVLTSAAREGAQH